MFRVLGIYNFGFSLNFRIEIGKTYSVSIKQSKNFQTIKPLRGLGGLALLPATCCQRQWTCLKITPKYYCTLLYCGIDIPHALWSSTCPFDKFLLAVVSRDLSQADKSIISWVIGSRTFFCLATTEAWTFSKINALNPLKFTSHQKNWEKCLLFNLANFWNIKQIAKRQIVFLYNCKFYNSKI